MRNGTAPSSPLGKDTAQPAVTLRVMATSDLHMHLAPHDYHADQPTSRSGLCLTASLIAAARAEAEGAILLDNGDFLQGSPLGDYVARTGLRPHPMIRAMNHLRYDAVNLGNHEFSHGINTLAAALVDARFPILSANTIAAPQCRIAPHVVPWTIVTRDLPGSDGQRHRIRVGIIGVLPPETAVWDKQAIAGQVHMLPMTETVRQQVPALRAAGADVIVALAHAGPGASYDLTDSGDGARAIAQLDGVDAVVMGHVHQLFPGPGLPVTAVIDPVHGTIHGKPAVMPGFFGSHLGVIDLTLRQTETGWRVAAGKSALRPIASRAAGGAPIAHVAPDAGLMALVGPVHEATRSWVRKPIGRTARAIHSFFALVTDCPSVQIVNQAQAAHVAQRLAGTVHDGLPVLSTTAPFRAGGLGGPDNFTFVPPGDVLLRHVADLYIHPNTIMALRLTGAQLRGWLECSVRGYRQITPGLADQPLLDPDLPSFLYDTIHGLTYRIDLSQPGADHGGSRIADLRWNGKPVDPAQPFILATNSYRGSGSGGYAPVDGSCVVLAEQTANRDVLSAYLEKTLARGAGDLPWPEPAWRFCAMPGTSVTFDTSPRAADHLADQPGLNLTPLYRTADGFLRLRLDLAPG